jgi:hypothetical protein
VCCTVAPISFAQEVLSVARFSVQAAASSTSAIIGALALGIVLGLFLGRLLLDLSDFGVADLATLVGVIAAGAVVNFISSLQGGPEALASYAVGLLVGIAAYVLLFNTGAAPEFAVLPGLSWV